MSRLAPRIVFASANVTAAYGELLLCNTAAGGFTVTLPRPSIGLGPIEIKKVTNGPNDVTVARSGTALIDGATSMVLANYNEAVTLVPNGTDWVVIASVAGTTPPPDVPNVPVIGTATAGDGVATGVWTAPVGGTAPTGYDWEMSLASDDSLVDSGSVGLVLTTGAVTAVNGTAVKFRVRATNAEGASAWTVRSNAVTPEVAATPGASDDFNRANENPLATSSGGQAWVHLTFGKFKVVGNKALATAGSGMTASVMESGLADFTLSVDIDLLGAGDQSVCFRLVDTSNFWLCAFSGNVLYLRKVVAGSGTWVGGFPAAPSSGLHTLEIVCAGSSIETFVDGVAKHAATDSFNATATLHGLSTGNFSEDLTSTWDSFSVVPLPSP